MQRKNKIILVAAAGIIAVLFIIIVTAIILSVSSVQRTSSFYEGQDGEIVTFESQMLRTMDDSVFFKEEGTATATAFELTAGSTAVETDQKIIKTGYLDIVVDAVDETATKITALTSGLGGYIQNSSIYEREDGTKYGTITVRIPVKEFENALLEIKKLAVAVDTETSSGQDVTEEYTDLAARLKNSQAQETEFLEILKKAETVTDILAVQSYLGQVREEIEILQGRIKYLENLTGYSTVTVSLSEEPTLKIPSKEFRPWSTIKEACQSLIALFQILIIFAVWFVILGGGLLLPAAVVVGVIYLIVKRRMKKQKK